MRGIQLYNFLSRVRQYYFPQLSCFLKLFHQYESFISLIVFLNGFLYHSNENNIYLRLYDVIFNFFLSLLIVYVLGGGEGGAGGGGAGGWIQRPVRQDPEYQGSRIKDQKSKIKNQRSRIGARIGARIKDQGPCPAMNEHPRRDTDVILRQSKAPIELFNSR